MLGNLFSRGSQSIDVAHAQRTWKLKVKVEASGQADSEEWLSMEAMSEGEKIYTERYRLRGTKDLLVITTEEKRANSQAEQKIVKNGGDYNLGYDVTITILGHKEPKPKN